MRAVRLGSYSTVATVAGTPTLWRRKSMTRKRRLWPPPRNREVMRPLLLRPPDRDIRSVSDFSGRVACDSPGDSGGGLPGESGGRWGAPRRGCRGGGGFWGENPIPPLKFLFNPFEKFGFS